MPAISIRKNKNSPWKNIFIAAFKNSGDDVYRISYGLNLSDNELNQVTVSAISTDSLIDY